MDAAGLRRYRDPAVASDYDRRRYSGFWERINEGFVRRAVLRAVRSVGGLRTMLDVPCGTGRFTHPLQHAGLRMLGSDLSPAMIAVAAGKGAGPRWVVADVTRLPFRDGAFDGAFNYRFLVHLDADRRVVALREMARVSRRALILGYDHRHSLKHLSRELRHRLFGRKAPKPRVDRADVERDAERSGLAPPRIYRVAPGLSENWVVVMEKPGVRARRGS